MFRNINFQHHRQDCRFSGRQAFAEPITAEETSQHFGCRGRHPVTVGVARPWPGFGGGRERLFDAGDIRLVILKLLSEQPSYGYQLMKTMEERLAGGYTPAQASFTPPSPCSRRRA